VPSQYVGVVNGLIKSIVPMRFTIDWFLLWSSY